MNGGKAAASDRTTVKALDVADGNAKPRKLRATDAKLNTYIRRTKVQPTRVRTDARQ